MVSILPCARASVGLTCTAHTARGCFVPFTADFFVLFLAVIHRDVLYRQAAQRAWDADRSEGAAVRVRTDFTLAPRTMLNDIKLLYYRYFYRLVIVLTMVGGTSNVSVLSFVYLFLSLVMLSYGEGVLLNPSVRRWVRRESHYGRSRNLEETRMGW